MKIDKEGDFMLKDLVKYFEELPFEELVQKFDKHGIKMNPITSESRKRYLSSLDEKELLQEILYNKSSYSAKIQINECIKKDHSCEFGNDDNMLGAA
jgi:hypothetical protein